MPIVETSIPSVLLIKPRVFSDVRGWFIETYSTRQYYAAGIHNVFIQDNHSFSAQKGTLRGLHFQKPPMAQTKLIHCTRGAILDIAVDIRNGSPTYLKWVRVELSAENKQQLLIPKGFAHGFITLTDDVEVQYKVDNDYSPENDCNIRYNDPTIGIDWGIEEPFLSDKDRNAPFLKDCDATFEYLETEGLE